MASTKNIVWTVSSLVVFFILINAVIVKTANNYDDKLFFVLLTTIAFLAVVLYYIRRIKLVALHDYNLLNKEGDSYPSQIEGLSHFNNYSKVQEEELEVSVGNARCSQPYHVSILNTAAINYNGFNKFFIPPVKRGYEPASMDKLMAEDEMSTYSLNAEDLVWQIGPEYYGCRKGNRNFNPAQFKKNASRPNIKMIQLNMPDVSITSYCSVLPSGFAVSKNGIPANQSVSHLRHTAYRSAEGMILFIGKLQELSKGKPVGFKLFIGNEKELYEICYAICKTQIIPDFIVIEGSDDLSGENISEISDDRVMSLFEALQFVSKTLQHYGLDKEISIIAAGKINSGFDVLKMIALGADFVFDYVPAQTISAFRKRFIEKSHNDAINEIIGIMKVCGFKNRNDITLAKLLNRIDMLPLKATDGHYDNMTNSGSVKMMNQNKLKINGDAFKKHAAFL